MQESKTAEQLKQEYSNLCLRAGDIQYKMKCNQRDLDMIQQEMQNLDIQYVQAVELAKRVQAEVDAKTAAAAPETAKEEG